MWPTSNHIKWNRRVGLGGKSWCRQRVWLVTLVNKVLWSAFSAICLKAQAFDWIHTYNVFCISDRILAYKKKRNRTTYSRQFDAIGDQFVDEEMRIACPSVFLLRWSFAVALRTRTFLFVVRLYVFPRPWSRCSLTFSWLADFTSLRRCQGVPLPNSVVENLGECCWPRLRDFILWTQQRSVTHYHPRHRYQSAAAATATEKKLLQILD